MTDDVLRTAICRAREYRRSDPLLDDPLVRYLVSGLDPPVDNGSPAEELATILRTIVVDGMLLSTVIDHHIHTVVTLGAGLDTRPYRLVLPSDLRWVELDGEQLLTYKQLRLVNVSPSCRIERVAVDLADPNQRQLVCRQVTKGVTRGLLLTEGLTCTPEMLAYRWPPGLKWWILDQPATDDRHIEALPIPSWRIAEYRPAREEALHRAFARLRQLEVSVDAGEPPLDLGGVWLLRRNANAPTRRL